MERVCDGETLLICLGRLHKGLLHRGGESAPFTVCSEFYGHTAWVHVDSHVNLNVYRGKGSRLEKDLFCPAARGTSVCTVQTQSVLPLRPARFVENRYSYSPLLLILALLCFFNADVLLRLGYSCRMVYI